MGYFYNPNWTLSIATWTDESRPASQNLDKGNPNLLGKVYLLAGNFLNWISVTDSEARRCKFGVLLFLLSAVSLLWETDEVGEVGEVGVDGVDSPSKSADESRKL